VSRPKGSKNKQKVNADGIPILKSRKPRIKTVNWYWTDEHEQRLADYINAGSKEERSVIYNDLQKPIRKMISIILKRYFLTNTTNHLTHRELEELITDCEIHLIELSIPLFNPDRGKGYAFIGTSSKRFFQNVFYQQKKNKTENIFDLETGEIVHDIIIQPEEFEIDTDLYDAAVEKITSIYEQVKKELHDHENNDNKRYKNNSAKKKNMVFIFEKLLEFFIKYKNKKYSRWTLTYFMLKETGLRVDYIYRLLRDEHDLGHVIVGTKWLTINRIENLYALADHKQFPTIEHWLLYKNEETPESSIYMKFNFKLDKNERRKAKIKKRNEIKEQES
jgi:hypothetical protein